MREAKVVSGGLSRPGNPSKEFPKSRTIGVEDWADSVQDKAQKGFVLRAGSHHHTKTDAEGRSQLTLEDKKAAKS